MPTFAADQDAQLDPLTVEAWSTYYESVRDLEGAEYLAAESEAWDKLQRELAELSIV